MFSLWLKVTTLELLSAHFQCVFKVLSLLILYSQVSQPLNFFRLNSVWQRILQHLPGFQYHERSWGGGGVGVEVTAVIKTIDKEDYTGSAIKEPIILIGRQIITNKFPNLGVRGWRAQKTEKNRVYSYIMRAEILIYEVR